MLPKRDIYKSQTEIMQWLETRGHKVIYGKKGHSETKRNRACTMKRRYASVEEAKGLAGGGMTIYECRYCLGFHAATPR